MSIGLPRTTDAKQALRLRRFGLATFSYVIATAMVTIAWAFGVLPTSTLLEAAIAFVAINLALYVTIRTGFNLRFRDPSLTRFQILAAITVLMYVVYHMEEGREVGLFACFVVFLFGIFRLRTREFVVITLYTLGTYALVINLLMHLRPDAIPRVANEWMAWLGLAGFLPCFAIIGEQINALRIGMRENEARFRCLSEMSSDFFWETDTEHRIVSRSSDLASNRTSVLRQAPKIGERRWEIPYVSPDAAGWQEHRRVLDAHAPFRDFELSRLGVDGSERHVSIGGDPVFDASGKFKGYQGVGTDITRRKRAEQALRDSAHTLRVFADNIPAMAVSWGLDLRCRFANKRFGEFFGLVVDDIIGMHVREIFGEDVFPEIERQFLLALGGQPVVYQRTRRLPNGNVQHLEINLLPDMDDQGNVLGCFSQATDITEHKLAQQRIQRVAHHDGLTGLPNRLLFNDRLDQAISAAKRESRQFALLYLDLNLFKPVNDNLGHAVGDALLQAVAGRIRRVVRESDTVARIGGDEFAVILLHVTGREEAETVAAKIVEALAVPFELGGVKEDVRIGVSVGIALYPTDAGDADALVRVADARMYQAKQIASGILSRAA